MGFVEGTRLQRAIRNGFGRSSLIKDIMSGYGAKQGAAKYWLGKRKAMAVSKTAKRYKKSGVVGVGNFSRKGPRLGAPLTAVLKTRFRVAGALQLNGGAAGAIATATLYGNSLFDPFGTAGAGQPRGFDQLTPLYAKYRVRNCKINVKFLNDTASAAAFNGSVIVGVFATDQATAPTSYRDGIECGYCVWDGLSCGQDSKADLTLNVDMAKFKGRPVTDDEMTADVAANPADLCYLHVFVQSTAAVDLNALTALITMDFDADMFDPVNVAAS